MRERSASSKLNVFVLGLDDFNRRLLATIRNAEGYRFHGLFSREEVDIPEQYFIPEMIDRALAELRAFPGSVDAIIGYFDFPVCTILPILRREMGLPTPSLESVLRCEHKYWSRLEQQQCIPEHIPDFAAVDPFAPGLEDRPPFAFPFWIKPVKAMGSYLGFRVKNLADWRHAVAEMRAKISRIGEPFGDILDRAELPAEIASLGGTACLAETIIHGRQCTLEGYVLNGETEVYGIVDSLRHANRSSFGRYQYPSRLPSTVHARMIEIARRALAQVGYDNAPFNIEMFYAARQDRIWLLEMNTRASMSHCPLFQMVDGRSHHEVMIEMAMGRRPEFPHRQGAYRHAAKFMVRRYKDARISRVPSAADIERMEREVPGSLCQVEVKSGMRLGHLKEQDSYTYELAAVFVGAQSQKKLLQKYRRCLSLLPFEFEEMGTSELAA